MAAAASSAERSVERSPLVRILYVPSYMSYFDLCGFCRIFICKALEMLFDRYNETDGGYSVLIKFDEQSSAESFYRGLSGRRFPSLEEGDVCNIQFVLDETIPTRSAESYACGECRENIGHGHGCILTMPCGRSYHYLCFNNRSESSCPVCRYCLKKADELKCATCQCSRDIWICALCSYVGCGRNKNGHSIEHWEKTQHSYALELHTLKVWNFHQQNYADRLIQVEACKKLTALGDAAESESMSVLEDYSKELIEKIKEDNKKEVSAAIEQFKDTKIQELESKYLTLMKEKELLDDANKSLVEDVKKLNLAIQNEQNSIAATTPSKDEQIQTLKEELEKLKPKIEDVATSSSADPKDASSSGSSKKKGKGKRK